MKRLTAPQVRALEILAERDPAPVYPSNMNAPTEGRYASHASLGVLVERGLARKEEYGRIAKGYLYYITAAGRAALDHAGASDG